jgi:hypothetical protein
LVLYAALFVGFRYFFRRAFFSGKPKNVLLTSALMLVTLAGMIIPVRGGFQLAPINQSSVYFSTNIYANHAAINASWNFLHSVLSKGSVGKNPYQYLSAKRLAEIRDSLYTGGTDALPFIHSTDGKPVNVIVVIWESFTE